MRILPTPPPTSLQTPAHLRPELIGSVNALTAPGQVLSAVVKQALGDQHYALQLAKGELVAHSIRPLQVGERLQLQVQRSDAGQVPEVRRLDPPTQPMLEQLRQVLPRQQDAEPLLLRLQQLLASVPQNGRSLPPEVMTGLRQFMDQLPAAQQLMRPDGLQQAVQLSGLFHDTALLTGQPLPDLKTQLLTLWTLLTQARQQLTPAQLAQHLPLPPAVAEHAPRRTPAGHGSALPGSLFGSLSGAGTPISASGGHLGSWLSLLLGDVDGLLSRIESHQLMTLQQRESGQLHWFIDLPVRHGQGADVLRLQVHRAADNEAETADSETAGQRPWVITLGFDFAETGALVVKAVLADDISLCLHADRTETLDRIEATRQALEVQLTEITGLPVQVQARQGLPHPDTLTASLPPLLRDSA